MARSNSSTEDLDKSIGMKIHELRLVNGVSRQQLARKIDVTHQQLLKYENATNRVAASRLQIIAKALKKPVSYFFEDSKIELPENHKRMAIEVSRNFMKIKCPTHQNAVNALIKTLSEA